MDDRGLAALAAALHSVNVSPHTEETDPQFAEWAAAILGERGVFLPDGLPHGYDPLTDDEMAELIENPMLVHLYDAHRLVAALATIATLRAALGDVLSSEHIALVLQMERNYSEGNAYRPVIAAGFVSVRLAADLSAALATAKEAR
jgi:hypothetical protein